jgi:hypothetical protein
MIQKYIDFVVFKVDSTWTERSPGGVQPECMEECKVPIKYTELGPIIPYSPINNSRQGVPILTV